MDKTDLNILKSAYDHMNSNTYWVQDVIDLRNKIRDTECSIIMADHIAKDITTIINS